VAERLVLAIDQGTSATKCLLLDADIRVVSRSSVPLTAAYPHPGWVEQSPDELWAGTQTAVVACVGGRDPESVVAVGISNQRESLVLWDAVTGEVAGPLVGWQDQRTAADCDRLLADGAGEVVRRRSGLPLDPMAGGQQPMGRGHLVEAGNASRTQLMDVAHLRWDRTLLEIFGINEEVLPRIVASTGPFVDVRGVAGLQDGTPVTAVLGDSHAALFAHGIRDTGETDSPRASWSWPSSTRDWA
jgi:glycerol kinase